MNRDSYLSPTFSSHEESIAGRAACPKSVSRLSSPHAIRRCWRLPPKVHGEQAAQGSRFARSQTPQSKGLRQPPKGAASVVGRPTTAFRAPPGEACYTPGQRHCTLLRGIPEGPGEGVLRAGGSGDRYRPSNGSVSSSRSGLAAWVRMRARTADWHIAS